MGQTELEKRVEELEKEIKILKAALIEVNTMSIQRNQSIYRRLFKKYQKFVISDFFQSKLEDSEKISQKQMNRIFESERKKNDSQPMY
ncbi:MAG: hypothetical protein J6S85_16390 [Methanobrevibacter sp.]|nr:hypothetical protein [Methanobrevibacter sp.]